MILIMPSQNNLWVDYVDVKSEYHADPKLLINKKVSELIALMIEL